MTGRLLLAVGVGMALACDGGNTPTGPTSTGPSGPSSAAIQVSIDPIEVIAHLGSPFSADWSVTIAETAGLAGYIDSVNAHIRDQGVDVAVVHLGADAITELHGTNRLDGRGSVTIPMSTRFEAPLGCRVVPLVVQVQFTDSVQNVLNGTAQENVAIRVPSLSAPAAGAEMDNGCRNLSDPMRWRFEWGECPGADAYHLWVMGPSASIPLIDYGLITAPTFTKEDFGFVTDQNRLGWKWRVRARYGTTWAEWTPEQTFDVEPENSDCR